MPDCRDDGCRDDEMQKISKENKKLLEKNILSVEFKNYNSRY